MSAFPPKADIHERIQYVCFVPQADICCYSGRATRVPLWVMSRLFRTVPYFRSSSLRIKASIRALLAALHRTGCLHFETLRKETTMRLFALAALAITAFLTTMIIDRTDANAVVCARGVYRAGCVGARGAVVAHPYAHPYVHPYAHPYARRYNY
jgi:hypothetical protein